MFRLSLLPLALATSSLTLAACGEETAPTEVEVPALAVTAGGWTPRAALPTNAVGTSLVAATNAAGQSLVYALGGRVDGFTGFRINVYDVTADAWAPVANPDARVFVERSNGAAKIGTKLYLTGGYDWGSGSREASSRVWAYDVVRDRLVQRASFPKFTAEGVSGVIDGKLYVLPGVCSGDGWPAAGYCETEPIRQLYRYDPASDSWIIRKAAPHFHRAGGAGVLDGKLYVVGGFQGFTPVAWLDVYDPATNSWQTRASIPTAGAASATVFQGSLFVVVTTPENDRLVSRAWAYLPESNSWRSRAAPPVLGAITKVTLVGTARVFGVSGTGDETSGPVASALYTR